MTHNKVSITIRLEPKLYEYVKQQAPDNKSRFLEELVRTHALNNIQDDVVARLGKSLLNNPDFISALTDRISNQQNTLTKEQQSVLDRINYI